MTSWERPGKNDPKAWDLCETLWRGSVCRPSRGPRDNLGRWERHLRWALWDGQETQDRPGEEDPDTHAVRLLRAKEIVGDAVREARFIALTNPDVRK